MKLEIKKYRYFKGNKTLAICEAYDPILRLHQLRRQKNQLDKKELDWTDEKDIEFEEVKPKKDGKGKKNL